jgi:predicted metalloprotease
MKGSAMRLLKGWLGGLAVAVAALGLSPGVAQAQASQPMALHVTGSTACPAGDLEGAFTSSPEMKAYLDCVIPSVEQWIDATYADMAHPHYYFVPVGGAGAEGDGGCAYDETSLQYCLSSGNIYLGEASLWQQYSVYGDAAPVVVLAHEVTHHFQEVAGVPRPTSPHEMIPQENQADCGAGAFMAYAAQQGWLNVEDDIADLANSLAAAGEKEGPDRTHGTSDERLHAFDVGYVSGDGLYACVDFVPGTPIIT